MNTSQDYRPQAVVLLGPAQVELAAAKVRSAPVGAGLEVVIRPVGKQRGLDANARMWAGPLKDISEQAYVGGRRYSAEVWHELFKAEFLPEIDDTELDSLVKKPEEYKKWDINPKHERVLVGSTTDLTKRGFALYVQKLEAYGANLGVLFHESPSKYA